MSQSPSAADLNALALLSYLADADQPARVPWPEIPLPRSELPSLGLGTAEIDTAVQTLKNWGHIGFVATDVINGNVRVSTVSVTDLGRASGAQSTLQAADPSTIEAANFERPAETATD